MFFSAREREKFNKSCNLIVPVAGGILPSGPPQWTKSVVLIYLAVIVNLLPFVARRCNGTRIPVRLSLYNFKQKVNQFRSLLHL